MRYILFLLVFLPFFASAQPSEVAAKKIRATEKLQLDTATLTQIVRVISVASTHSQSPTAKAVYDFCQTLGGVTGSGTSGYLSRFTGSTAIGNSGIFQSGVKYGVNTTTVDGVFNIEMNSTQEKGLKITSVPSTGFQRIIDIQGSHNSTLFPINVECTTTQGLFTNFSHTGNTSNLQDNAVQIMTGGTSGGDPYLRFRISGQPPEKAATMGIDNQDADKFIITRASFLNTPSTGIVIDSAFRIGLNFVNPTYSVNAGGTDAFGIPKGTTIQRPTISEPGIRHNTTHGGAEIAGLNNVWYRISSTTAPTVGWNGGVIGTGGTVTLATGSNEVAGTVIITTGTNPTGTNVSAITLTFANSYNGAVTPFPIICQANAITATEWNKFHVGTANSTLFQIGVAAQLAANTTYRINYRVTQ